MFGEIVELNNRLRASLVNEVDAAPAERPMPPKHFHIQNSGLWSAPNGAHPKAGFVILGVDQIFPIGRFKRLKSAVIGYLNRFPSCGRNLPGLPISTCSSVQRTCSGTPSGGPLCIQGTASLKSTCAETELYRASGVAATDWQACKGSFSALPTRL